MKRIAGSGFHGLPLGALLLTAVLLVNFAAVTECAAEMVTFRFQPEGPPSAIYLAGSFNNWSPNQDRMLDSDGDGIFEFTVDLPDGRHEYKFVADGNWITDENAAEFVDDPYGGKNSVVVVGEDAGEPAAAPPAAPSTTTPTPEGDPVPVTLTYEPVIGGPREIFLAGTFNDWNAAQDRLTDENQDGIWEITIDLSPGRYEYKFVVDGNWFTDENAAELVDDPYGGKNSILVVDATGAVSGETLAAASDGLFHVTFSHAPESSAQNAYIAGTFNDWSTSATPMSDADGDGTFAVTLVLPGGSYGYKFVVDGSWFTDETAESFADDGFGGRNSIIEVNDRFPRVDLQLGDGQIYTEGISHTATLAERNLLSDNEALFRARSYRNDVESVGLAYRETGEWSVQPMRVFSHDTAFDHLEALLSSETPFGRFEYAFTYRDGEKELMLGPNGFEEPSETFAGFVLDPATIERIDTPDWVRDGVFYQIFPDRFFNGDKSNDPNFEEWYYEGRNRLPRVGKYDGEYYHLVKDWYDVAGLSKSPYRSDGKPDWFSFYGGDIQGVIEKLPYLQELGVTIIYFNPVFQARSNHKYDTADYMKIDPHFADEALFRQFVEQSHAVGIRIVLDTVFNHCGDSHWAFRDCVEKGSDSDYWSWFEWKKWPLPDPQPAGFKAEEYYECWWNFGSLPDLNFDLAHTKVEENGIRTIEEAQPNQVVVDHLLESVRYWFETLGIDGLRLDVPNEVPPWFWRLFADEVQKLNPDAYIVAELWGDASNWIRPDMFDATMNYRYFRDPVLKWIAQGQGSAAVFDRELAPGRFVYPPQAQQAMMNLIDSHDTVRFLTQASGDRRRLMLAAFFQMTYVGAPHIYYGDEIATEGGGDPDCRRPFHWKWPEEAERREVHDHYTKLIEIRKGSQALRRGSFQALVVDGQIYAYARRSQGETVLVVLNNGPQEAEIEIDLADLEGIAGDTRFVDLMGGDDLVAQGSVLRLPVGPVSGRILRVASR